MAEDNNTPEIEITDPVEAVRKKYDNILSLVIVVLFIGFGTLLVTVLGMAIDAWNTKTVYFQSFNEQQQLLDQQKEILMKLDAMPTSARSFDITRP